MSPLPEDPVAGATPAIIRIVARQSDQYQESHLYQNDTKNQGGYLIVLSFLALGAMVMRAWCRLKVGERFGRDDWTYFVGTTIAIASFIVSVFYTFDAGLGEHWVALTPEQKALFPKFNYAFNILNVIAYPLIKISFLLLYIRLFYVLKTFCRVMWGAVVFVSAVMIANTMVSIFLCVPIRGFWDTTVPAKCIDSVAYYYWTAVINCCQDLFLLVVPLPVLWKRKINHKKAVIALFMMGGLTFVISILRIVYYTSYSADDPSYSFLKSGYCSPGEVCLAVIVASAPTWKPLWHYFATRVNSLSQTVRDRMTNSNSPQRAQVRRNIPQRVVLKGESALVSDGVEMTNAEITTAEISDPRSDSVTLAGNERSSSTGR